MKKHMMHEERDETPSMEARAHSPKFLMKAARMAKGKRGGKRMRKIGAGRS